MPPAMPRPALVLVTDRRRAESRGRTLEEAVAAAVEGGADVVQLREKDLSTAVLVTLGTRVRDAIAGRALLLVNGDADAAVALGAAGVPLPADARDIAGARTRLGGQMLLSVAAHSLEEARRAAEAGADIVQLGTAFASASHPGATPLGVDGVRAICRSLNVPVIAIGGVTADNAAALIAAGVAGVAVIGAMLDAPDPRDAASALRRAIAAGAPAR